jgi:hypothetical protein
MPISIKTFERGEFKKRITDRNKHPVAILLNKKPNKAYTVKEICRYTKMKPETVRSMLRSLTKDKKILHKIPYFAWRSVKKKAPAKKKVKRRK